MENASAIKINSCVRGFRDRKKVAKYLLSILNSLEKICYYCEKCFDHPDVVLKQPKLERQNAKELQCVHILVPCGICGKKERIQIFY